MMTIVTLAVAAGFVAGGDPLRPRCPQGPSAAGAQAVAEVHMPTILPDRCSVLVTVPYVAHRCDPHGAVDPIQVSVGWKEVFAVIELQEDLCVSGRLIVGRYEASAQGVGASFTPTGWIVPWSDDGAVAQP